MKKHIIALFAGLIVVTQACAMNDWQTSLTEQSGISLFRQPLYTLIKDFRFYTEEQFNRWVQITNENVDRLVTNKIPSSKNAMDIVKSVTRDGVDILKQLAKKQQTQKSFENTLASLQKMLSIAKSYLPSKPFTNKDQEAARQLAIQIIEFWNNEFLLMIRKQVIGLM
jgi:hypothetical protein